MIPLTRQYPQRRAFITGAASGFGLALSRLLAADGWTLGLADISGDGLTEAAGQVEALGGQPHIFLLDVSDGAAFREAAAAFLDRHEGVDVVINNAGIAVGGLFEETPLADWQAVLQINLMGVVHGCHAFVPALKRAGGGHIINVASIAAVAAGPYMAAYNTAKAGILALSETLYSECKHAGVCVSVVLPFFFQTNIAQHTRGGPAARLMTETLIARSEITADEVAAYTLAEAARGRLHILYPREARRIWWLKRLMLGRFLAKMVEQAATTARFLARHGAGGDAPPE